MPTKTPLLTIILPTKNRHFLIPYAISSLLNQEFKDFELILLDNDDTPNTASVFFGPLWGSMDERFRYIRTGGMWMTENFEVGLNYARGKYFWLMEDKAFVVNGGLEIIMSMIEKHHAECLSFALTNHEVGPEGDVPDAPIININFFNKNAVTPAGERSSVEAMGEFLEQGYGGFMRAPRTTNSVLSMNIVNRIRHRTGSFYKSPDPDVTSSCLTLDAIDTFHHTDYAPVSNAFGNQNIGNDKLSNGHSFRSSVRQGSACLQAVPSHEWRDMEQMPIGAFPLFHNMIFYDFLKVQPLCNHNVVRLKLLAKDYFKAIVGDAGHLDAIGNPMQMTLKRIYAIRDNYPYEDIRLQRH